MSHTICIPSHKNFSDSIDAINSAILFALQTNSSIIISDNSECKIKLNYFNTNNINNLIYLNSRGLDYANNWFSTMENVSTEFLSILSDDDLIFNISNNSIDYSDVDPSVVAIRPSVNYWATNVGIYKTSNFSITDSNAKSRLINYMNVCNGTNSTLFSAFRTELVASLYKLWNDHHPTRSGYTDWSLVLALISSGKLVIDPIYSLTYKNTNWYGSQEFIIQNIINLFINSNLTKNASTLLPLFNGIDSYILIMRSFSPLNYSEKIEAASFILTKYINSFLNLDNSILFSFNSKEVELFSQLSKLKTVNESLILILKIISLQRDDLNIKYRSFYFNSILSEFELLKN